ncbi:hypothetical protein ACFSM5_15155 [Lacibacterium aquatile]|uniref:HAMP domain-containing protein n=1 Tax=Lacibacterium aquatile TaxID=1168082 RepID=A0ABW5DWR4_9PROT
MPAIAETGTASSQPKPPQAKSGSFRLWIVGTIVATVAATIVLLALLNYAKFDRIYQQHYTSRFILVLDDMKQTVERFLALGLSLGSMGDLGGGLTRAQALNTEIRTILLTSDTGEILTRTDGGGVALPTPWLKPAGEMPHRLELGNGLIALTAPVRTDFGALVGQVVLVHSDEGRQASTRQLLIQLGTQTAGIITVGGAIAAILWMYYLGRLRRRILTTAAAIEALDGTEDGLEFQKAIGEPLDPQLPTALEKTLAAQIELNAAGFAADMELPPEPEEPAPQPEKKS